MYCRRRGRKCVLLTFIEYIFCQALAYECYICYFIENSQQLYVICYYLHFSDGETKPQRLSDFSKVIYLLSGRGRFKMTGLTPVIYTFYPSLLI